MRFEDTATANAYYAARYAEYAAGRLSAEALQRDREALDVVDAYGRRYVMDAYGRWIEAAPDVTDPSRLAAPARYGIVAGAIGVVVAVLIVLAPRGDSGVATPAPSSAEVSPPGPTSAATGLVAELQRGGYVIYLRHAAREEVDESVTDPADCSQQANLTGEGRTQATTLGSTFTALQIRAGPVYASPYCRTRETAELAFGTVTPVAELAGASLVPPVDPAVQRQALEAILTTPPPPGSNAVVVGHGEVVEAVTGQAAPDFAGAIIFAPQDGSYRLVAPVPYERIVGWATSCPPDCS
jgi:phosphohistidine phosphatase SixA